MLIFVVRLVSSVFHKEMRLKDVNCWLRLHFTATGTYNRLSTFLDSPTRSSIRQSQITGIFDGADVAPSFPSEHRIEVRHDLTCTGRECTHRYLSIAREGTHTDSAAVYRG
jgi:hypothetical protein